MLTGDILRHSADRLPDKAAVIADGRRLTFRELDRAADRMAHALLGLGSGKGHNVALLSLNRLEYPVVHFGAARAGCILAHMSVRYTPDDLVYVMESTDIEAVVVHADFLDTILAIRDRLPRLANVVVFGADARARDGALLLDDLLAAAPSTPPGVAMDADDPFAITYTSGTTGFPKGVLVSHRVRTNSSLATQREFGLREDDIVACVTPLFHVVGLFVWFQTAILNGCTCVLLDEWDPGRFIEAVERDAVSAALLVPTQIQGLLSHPACDPGRLANLRYVNYAGSPTPLALTERMTALLPDVIWVEHYGQSEVCPLTIRQPEHMAAKPTSAGRPFRNVEIAIFGLDGAPLDPGEPGEVVVRSDTRLIEYYKNPEETAALAFGPGGWMRTGDVGYLDEDGFLVLVDRSKDMIIAGGENIYPAEIENALYKHDAVAECAVFGVPDDYWGELPAAHVVLQAGAQATAEELMDFCSARIARHKRPRLIELVEALPKTAIGKIQKAAIRAPYWEGRERKI